MNIEVLAAGTSTERRVSKVSGANVCKALRARGHRAVLLDVFCGDENAQEGNFFPEQYDVEKAQSYISSFNDKITAMQQSRKSFFGPNVLEMCSAADVVFLALHGANGEDGRVQATFDLMGIKYTGTDYISSALAMDKTLTKHLFQAYGVPTAPAYSIVKTDAPVAPETKGLKYPVVVKAACQGSSVGVTIARDESEYQKAVDIAFNYGDHALVEQFIKGREFSVAVVDGKALPVIEIAPKQGWYDYNNKYQAGSTVETCPAQITAQETERMQRNAEKAIKALGIVGYGRIDFIMEQDGSMYALEANTLPGMTPTSLVPQEAAAVGVNFEQLCENLIEISLRRYNNKK